LNLHFIEARDTNDLANLLSFKHTIGHISQTEASCFFEHMLYQRYNINPYVAELDGMDSSIWSSKRTLSMVIPDGFLKAIGISYEHGTSYFRSMKDDIILNNDYESNHDGSEINVNALHWLQNECLPGTFMWTYVKFNPALGLQLLGHDFTGGTCLHIVFKTRKKDLTMDRDLRHQLKKRKRLQPNKMENALLKLSRANKKIKLLLVYFFVVLFHMAIYPTVC
jgi:hypothetical protein